MSSSKSNPKIFTKLLTVLFIGLKLTGFLDWSWIWVLSPMWIMFLLYIFVLILHYFITEK
jgi:hypothetical protein